MKQNFRFYYSAMNAGKSLHLLQNNFKHTSNNLNTLLFTSELDDRFGSGKIASRIGLEEEAITFNKDTNFFRTISEHTENSNKPVWVYVDESQFLNKEQVIQLCKVVDQFNVGVSCYGLRTDSSGKVFDGSKWLLSYADQLEPIEGLCWCGSNASMCLKVDADGKVVDDEGGVDIGLENKYVSVCREHWFAQKVKK